MKKSINQKLEKLSEKSNYYIVAVTRNKNTFCYFHNDFDKAFNFYFDKVKEESYFNALVNGKTIIGLYDVTTKGDKIIKQFVCDSNRFY